MGSIGTPLLPIRDLLAVATRLIEFLDGRLEAGTQLRCGELAVEAIFVNPLADLWVHRTHELQEINLPCADFADRYTINEAIGGRKNHHHLLFEWHGLELWLFEDFLQA